MTPLTITVNGDPRAATAPITVADVVASLGHDPERPGVAAAVGGVIVPRVQWPTHELSDGQNVEVLTAVQGGSR